MPMWRTCLFDCLSVRHTLVTPRLCFFAEIVFIVEFPERGRSMKVDMGRPRNYEVLVQVRREVNFYQY